MQDIINVNCTCYSSTETFHTKNFWKYIAMRLEWHQILLEETKFNLLWAVIQLVNIVRLKFKSKSFPII